MPEERKEPLVGKLIADKGVVADTLNVKNLHLGEPARDTGPLLSLGRLVAPADPTLFVGRSEQMKTLNDAWTGRRDSIVQIVADGGVGKSTIAWHWLDQLKGARYPDVTHAIDWSFYSQGQNEYATDSQSFLEEAARHFTALGLALGTEERTQAVQLGRAIGEHFVKVGGVLVLDGVEPLQQPPTPVEGRLKDGGLAALLRVLCAAAPPAANEPRRLAIITTRWPISDLKGSGVRTIDLRNLSADEGAEMLAKLELPSSGGKTLCSTLARDSEDLQRELKDTVREYDGHALALELLAMHLLAFYDGDLSMRRYIPPAPVGTESSPYRHAKRVMASYDRMFDADKSKSRVQVLYLTGLFDRPAPVSLLDTICRGSPIPGLTDALSKRSFTGAVNELDALRLLRRPSGVGEPVVAAHPLIREHYKQALVRRYAAAAREAHRRVFVHLQEPKAEIPGSIQGIGRLIQAVIHGCKAGLHKEALHDVLLARVLHGDDAYAVETLGATEMVLSALSHYFEAGDWGQPVLPDPPSCQGVDKDDELTVLSLAGKYLMATRGYSSLEAEQCYTRLGELAKKSGISSHLISWFYWRWWRCAYVGECHESAQMAEELLRLATTPDLRIVALRTQAAIAFWLGDFKRAEDRAERAFDVRDPSNAPGSDRNTALRAAKTFLNEPAINSLVSWSLAKWHLGYSDVAIEKIHLAVALAGDLGHNHTRTIAMFFCAMIHQFRREQEDAATIADDLIDLASRCGYSLWVSGGLLLRGWADVMGGRPADGLASMERGSEGWRSAGARIVTPYWCALLAETYMESGHLDDALRHVSAGCDAAEGSGERWWESELYRLRGELLAKRGGETDRTVASFERAISIADGQASRSLKLRALVSAYEFRPSAKALQQVKELYTSLEGIGADLASARKALEHPHLKRSDSRSVESSLLRRSS